jgi:hypothetical protein
MEEFKGRNALSVRHRNMSKTSRVNMRVPTALLDWFKEYAKSRNTTVTRLFIDRIVQLKEKDTRNVNAAPITRR